MIKVMVIDDHKMFRDAIVDKLNSRENLQVIYETGSGKDAIIKSEFLNPDIIIMDISLPDIDGIEASKEILKVCNCKIILLSMYKMPELIEYILSIGIKGYILKNDAYDDLIYAIEKILNGEVFISSSLENEKEESIEFIKRKELTKREIEIIKLIGNGLTTKEIAEKLNISIKTVETHRTHIFKKLNCKNIADLIKKAMNIGLINL